MSSAVTVIGSVFASLALWMVGAIALEFLLRPGRQSREPSARRPVD